MSCFTDFLSRLVTLTPLLFSHPVSWGTEFGFERPVILLSSSVISSLDRSSMERHPSTKLRSIWIPLSLILSEIAYSFQTKSGTGYLLSRSTIPCSVSTSRMLYFLKSSHFSGASEGRFLVLPPLALVGLQGTQKYRIRSLPSSSFCLSSPKAEPTPFRESGSPL